MRRLLSIVVIFVLISLVLTAAFAETTKTSHIYTGGIEGRVKKVLNPPLLTGPAKLVWDAEKKEGTLTLNMAGKIATCTVSSSDGKNLKGNFSCNFGGYHAVGPVEITLSKPDASGIPQKFKGNFNVTVPDQGGAEYIGTFNGAYRNW